MPHKFHLFLILKIFCRHEESIKSGATHSGSTDPGNKNTVQGTFEDLSEEEKTRALLQFLQYHQQLEQESETKRFKEMIQGNTEPEESPATLTPSEIQVQIRLG